MKKRLLLVLMLTFLIGGGSLFSLAEDITFPTTPVDLWGGVQATWDATHKTLNIEGNGKIDKNKWISFKNNNKLTTDAAENITITFAEKVQFPDNASNFFFEVKSANIVFHPNMDTSNVTNMENMFRGAVNFNTNISTWNTENVTTMQSMFRGAVNFNQNLENWNVTNLQTAASMFNGATSFNGNINWKTLTKLTSINAMFKGAKKFNKPLNNWDTSTITDMSSTFDGASNFNQNIGNWNTSQVTRTYAMFKNAEKFNQNIGNWNTSKVTDMMSMFEGAKVFNQNLKNWDTSQVTLMEKFFANARAFEGKGVENWIVENVKNMVQTFHNTQFNTDISKWKPKSLINAKEFISSYGRKDPVFSRENHDKLLEEWNKNLTLSSTIVPFTIDAPYCLGKKAKDELIAKGYNHNRNPFKKDRRDCELKAKLEHLTGSQTTINNTLTVTSLLPAEQIKARIVPEWSSASYSNWNCTVKNATSPWEIECTFDVTSTENGRNIKLEISDGVKTEAGIFEYLIDGQGPEAPQVKIEMEAKYEGSTIRLEQFPQDRWSAGVKKCTLSYKDREGYDKHYDITSVPWERKIFELDGLEHDPVLLYYTIQIWCEDTFWNKGDSNEIKFPPLIEFSTENKTIIKENGIFTGTFTIYSPGRRPINTFSALSPDEIGITEISCTGTLNPSQSWKFNQENWQANDMEGENNETYKITCSYEGRGKKSENLKLQVSDKQGAQGHNSQSFTLDNHAPSISIEPNQAISSGDIKVTITITDNIKLNPDSVKIDGDHIDISKCSENTPTKLVCPYTITGPAIDKPITVTAQDSVRHETSIQSKEFTIDTQAPTITQEQITYENNWTLAKILFTATDQGLGFRTQADENEEGFHWNTLTYWFASQGDCSDYDLKGNWELGTTQYNINAHLELSKEFYGAENGKYFCVQVTDKVWNTASKALGKIDFSTPNTPNTPNNSSPPNTSSTPSTPQVGYSGGGGGSISLRRDTCPQGDYSASYYDGSCGTQQNEKKPESSDKAQTPTGEKKAYQENELFNTSIEDGKCYTRRPHLGILTSQLIPTTEEYNKAQSFLWSYEMTKYDSVDGYDPYRYLSRQEAAKIFSNFAINVLCRQPNKKLTVNYTDTQDADPSLKPYIELAYQLGIMKGSGQGDGSFRPYEFISKVEVNAVLIRMLLKSYLDETGLLRYTPYNQASHALNIISQEAGLEPIARNHVALMLFRAYKQQSFDWKEIDYFSYVLKNRADFVK